jgi:hypothetical protein
MPLWIVNLAGWFMGSKVGRYIVAGVGIAIAVGVTLLKVFNAGKDAERDAQNRDSLENLRERAETDANVDNLGPADLDRRMDRWVRK